MIGYVTLGTNNLEASTKFYDELFAVIGAGRGYEGDNFVAWGTSPDAPMVSVITPFDKQPATAGNGTMVAIAVESKEKVHEMHAKALELDIHEQMHAERQRVDNVFAELPPDDWEARIIAVEANQRVIEANQIKMLTMLDSVLDVTP